MSKKHNVIIPAEKVHDAFEALRMLAISRQEEKRNEPNGERRLALLKSAEFHAREELQAVCVDIASGVPYHDALTRHGISHIDFTIARHKNPAMAMVFSAAEEIRDLNDAQRCRSAFAKLLEGDTPNVKAVLAGLEHLGGKRWAKSGGGGEHGGGAKIVYNIQLLHAPKAESVVVGCENGARKAAEVDIIEVSE